MTKHKRAPRAGIVLGSQQTLLFTLPDDPPHGSWIIGDEKLKVLLVVRITPGPIQFENHGKATLFIDRYHEEEP